MTEIKRVPWKLGSTFLLILLVFGVAFAWCQLRVPYRILFSSRKHDGPVYCLAFSSDGRMLLSGGSLDATVQLWEVATGRLRQTFLGHKRGVSSVAFLPKGHVIVSGGLDGTVKLWDTITGKELRSFETKDPILRIVVARDGQILVAGTSGKNLEVTDPGQIFFWDLDSERLLKSLQHPKGPINALSASPDGQIVASGSGDRTIGFWDLTNYRILRSIDAHDDWISCVSFSPDGTKLASAGQDRKIKIWDVATGKEQLTLAGHQKRVCSISYAPDGKTLASASLDGTVRFWNVAAGQEYRQFNVHRYSSPDAIAFSPDGKNLAVGLSIGILELLDVETALEQK